MKHGVPSSIAYRIAILWHLRLSYIVVCAAIMTASLLRILRRGAAVTMPGADVITV